MDPDHDIMEKPEKSQEQDTVSKVRIITEQDYSPDLSKPIGRVHESDNGRAHKPDLVKTNKTEGDKPFDLKERSYENLVRFYREELRLIAGGERATKILTSYERGNLLNNGVLKYGNLHWFVSEKAKKYLEEI
jgi:hypothetical protein